MCRACNKLLLTFLQDFWQSGTGDDSWLTPGFPSVPAFCFQPVFCSCCRCAPVRWWKWYRRDISSLSQQLWSEKSNFSTSKSFDGLNTQKLEWISIPLISHSLIFLFPKRTCKEINAISLTVCKLFAVTMWDAFRRAEESLFSPQGYSTYFGLDTSLSLSLSPSLSHTHC